MALVHNSIVDARERFIAARLRNRLDQETGSEKLTLRKYLLPLESRLVHIDAGYAAADSEDIQRSENDQT